MASDTLSPSAEGTFASGREPLHARVTRALRHRILHAELAPGAKLHEVRLAAALKVSRTPLREALATLAREGFLESAPGRGYSVAALSSREMRELYAIIGELEVKALEWSGGGDTQTLTELAESNARLARSRDVDQALARNGEWHRALVRRCPNRQLRRVIEELRARVYRYEYYYFLSVRRNVATAVELHRTVMRALGRGDLAAACQAVREHWTADLDLMLPAALKASEAD